MTIESLCISNLIAFSEFIHVGHHWQNDVVIQIAGIVIHDTGQTEEQRDYQGAGPGRFFEFKINEVERINNGES